MYPSVCAHVFFGFTSPQLMSYEYAHRFASHLNCVHGRTAAHVDAVRVKRALQLTSMQLGKTIHYGSTMFTSTDE